MTIYQISILGIGLNHYSVFTNNLPEFVSLLEDSPSVLKFKVTSEGRILKAEHFGWGKYKKWVEKFYEN